MAYSISRMTKPGFLHIAFILMFLSGCAGVEKLAQEANRMAIAHGFEKSLIQTRHFLLTAYVRLWQPAGSASIYIEGDGHAFERRYRVSKNPTPVNPVGLKLALEDTSPNVIYIARPCQYIPVEKDTNCHRDYWTAKRYAPEVIEAMGEAINFLKQEEGIKKVRLIGYSGGGAVAAILAAQRDDVIDLRTVAGNLDIAMFARHHEVTPLSGSLNPADFARALIHVPQVHFVGDEDEIT